MKKTLITLAAIAVASVASATDFKWDGSKGEGWTTSYNWKDTQWVPTASDCHVYIGANGANAGTAVWDSQGWNLASLTLGSDSTAKLTGWGDFKVGTVNIGTGSSLILSGSSADIGGFDGTTTMDLTGAIKSTDAPKFTLSAGTFWGGDNKTIMLTGTLDLAALPDTIGSVTLVDISANSWQGGLTVDFSGLTLTNNNRNATLAWVGTKGGNGKLVLSYIPEPTTATLSLLALAGLAARRRRK